MAKIEDDLLIFWKTTTGIAQISFGILCCALGIWGGYIFFAAGIGATVKSIAILSGLFITSGGLFALNSGIKDLTTGIDKFNSEYIKVEYIKDFNESSKQETISSPEHEIAPLQEKSQNINIDYS